MKITKLGHCCLLIEKNGSKILTDPGNYSEAQNQVSGVNIILITHEHPDHLHMDSVKTVLKNNPNAKIYSNRGVGVLLEKQGITYELLEHGQSARVSGYLIEAMGEKHAPIYPTVPEVINTGYFIDNQFFYPGDAFYEPQRQVEILALPVAGPWMRLSEAIDYAKQLKPKAVFPVHDGMLKIYGPAHRLPLTELTKDNIKFIALENGQTFES
jgi:L-ascorbate metabolism protein UlaG (beta-lactamase superfamily)